MNILLVGKDTSINKVISDILENQNDINYRYWTPGDIFNKLKKETAGSIDVLIADLPSFSKSAPTTLQELAGIESVQAVLAIHIYTTSSLVDVLLDAGATGYIAQDTNEEELLKALRTIAEGRRFVAAKDDRCIKHLGGNASLNG